MLRALAIVGIFTFGGSFILLKLTNYLIPMRVTEAQESAGLDISQHGESMTSLRERIVEVLNENPALKKGAVPHEPQK